MRGTGLSSITSSLVLIEIRFSVLRTFDSIASRVPRIKHASDVSRCQFKTPVIADKYMDILIDVYYQTVILSIFFLTENPSVRNFSKYKTIKRSYDFQLS